MGPALLSLPPYLPLSSSAGYREQSVDPSTNCYWYLYCLNFSKRKSLTTKSCLCTQYSSVSDKMSKDNTMAEKSSCSRERRSAEIKPAGAHKMVRQGSKVLVLCGPSGSGKSSLLRLLFEEFPEKFGFSVSHTTRSPRVGEENGKHYHFTNKEDMEHAIASGEFLESAVFSNNMYGTSKAAVKTVTDAGKICVLDIDVEGVKQVKQTDLKPLLVFIKPPSLADLEKRLRGRNTETEDSLQRRLDAARKEMVYGEMPGNFHLILVNDNLDKAYKKLKEFVLREFEQSGDANDECSEVD